MIISKTIPKTFISFIIDHFKRLSRLVLIRIIEYNHLIYIQLKHFSEYLPTNILTSSFTVKTPEFAAKKNPCRKNHFLLIHQIVTWDNRQVYTEWV